MCCECIFAARATWLRIDPRWDLAMISFFSRCTNVGLKPETEPLVELLMIIMHTLIVNKCTCDFILFKTCVICTCTCCDLPLIWLFVFLFLFRRISCMAEFLPVGTEFSDADISYYSNLRASARTKWVLSVQQQAYAPAFIDILFRHCPIRFYHLHFCSFAPYFLQQFFFDCSVSTTCSEHESKSRSRYGRL